MGEGATVLTGEHAVYQGIIMIQMTASTRGLLTLSLAGCEYWTMIVKLNTWNKSDKFRYQISIFPYCINPYMTNI
ncbi:MAG: hypothetical protein DHS20C01_35950 [marine bacterium B5-7]|nr:MAG: hypothetical protein DHS20C01_35950 [marine bacterium B5-7]